MHACMCLCVCVSLCVRVHVRVHSHACTRTHRPFRGWITEELLSPSRLPPAGGTRALFLALSLSHFFFSLILSHSFSRSLAHFRACSLSLSLSLSLSSVSVCLSHICLNMASSTRLNMASSTLVAHVAVSSRMYIHFDHICVCTCDMNMAHAYI